MLNPTDPTPPANAGEKNIEQAFNDIQDAMIRLPGSTPDRCCEAAAQIIVDLRAQLASRPSPSEQAAKDAKIRNALNLASETLAQGTTEEMGGMPDMFSPDGGWDAWNLRVATAREKIKSALSLLGEPAKGSEA